MVSVSRHIRVLPALVLLLAGCAPAAAPPQGAPAPTELKVGAVLPLTGPFSASGGYFQQAYQLATDEVNGAGGLDIGGKKVQINLKILDDGSDATKSRSLVEQLATHGIRHDVICNSGGKGDPVKDLVTKRRPPSAVFVDDLPQPAGPEHSTSPWWKVVSFSSVAGRPSSASVGGSGGITRNTRSKPRCWR